MNLPSRLRPAAPSKHSKATAKSWHRVQISEGEADKMRALAECFGGGFHGFLSSAALSYIDELEKRLGLTAKQALAFTRAERKAFHRRFWSIVTRARIYGFDCLRLN